MWIYSLFKILIFIMKKVSSKASLIDFVWSCNSKLYSQNLSNLNIYSSKSDNFKLFLSDFFSMILNSWLNNLCNMNILSDNGKTLYIVNSSNIWLCGNLNKKLFDYFNGESDKNNIDIFCIWKKSFNFFVENWFNVIWYIKDCNEFSDLTLLFDFLNSSISNYSNVKLLFNTKNNATCMNLYSFNELELLKFVSDFWINCKIDSISNWISVDKNTLKELVMQFSQYIIYWAFLQNKVEELSIRKKLLKPVNRGLIMRKIVLSFNEKRQMLLTQKIIELMAVKECAMV